MKKNYILLMILTIGFVNGFSQTPYLGEIRIVSMSYAPKGWALCNGQLLSIAQNQALFSLLGTTYGGNGINSPGPSGTPGNGRRKRPRSG